MRGAGMVVAGLLAVTAAPARAVVAQPVAASPTPGTRSAGLDRGLASGEAVIWYLGHCGYAVRTANHLLLFDYIELEENPEARSLARGFVDPEEIRELPVRVFVSHSHIDHFDPLILEWRSTIPDIRYFFGWQAAGGERTHDLPGPRATLTMPGLRIVTVNSRHAGVDEVAFLVEVDGLVLFHGGDYQGRTARDAPSKAIEDMRFLRSGSRPPDLMFLGAWTGDPYLDIIRGLEPRVIFPGHWRKKEERYAEFASDLRRRKFTVPVPCPRRRGDGFLYSSGAVAALEP